MDVVLYPRVSTEKQAKKDLSIPEQIREMRAYCREHGHNIKKIYDGEAASARDDKRPVFQEMIEELLSGSIKAKGIIVYSLSRFFRNLVKANFYEEKLNKKEIRVISLTMPTENLETPFANAFKNFEYTVSQLQSDLNARYTLGGMKANARKGYFNGGTSPFGYRTKKVEDEHGNPKSILEIHPTEAEIVGHIFRLYTQKGFGTKKIACLLNSEGIRTRQGRKWSKDRIRAILVNSTYMGERIYNRFESKTKREKPKDQWIVFKVEAMVEKELFGQAQRVMKENSPLQTNPAVTASPTLLSELLKHKECGRSMTLETAKRGRYTYYNCRGYLREGSCAGQRIPLKVMDGEVLEYLTSKFFSVRRLKILLDQWLKERKDQKSYARQEDARIRAQLREEKRKLDNIYSLIEQGVVKERNINQRIEERLTDISLLEAKLTRVKKLKKLPVSSHLLTTAFLQEAQRKMTELFYQDSRFAKKYLKLFLDRILVNGEKVTLIARRDILLKAIVLNTGGNFHVVPTAGVEWLRGQDAVRTFSQEDMEIPIYDIPLQQRVKAH